MFASLTRGPKGMPCCSHRQLGPTDPPQNKPPKGRPSGPAAHLCAPKPQFPSVLSRLISNHVSNPRQNATPTVHCESPQRIRPLHQSLPTAPFLYMHGTPPLLSFTAIKNSPSPNRPSESLPASRHREPKQPHRWPPRRRRSRRRRGPRRRSPRRRRLRRARSPRPRSGSPRASPPARRAARARRGRRRRRSRWRPGRRSSSRWRGTWERNAPPPPRSTLLGGWTPGYRPWQ